MCRRDSQDSLARLKSQSTRWASNSQTGDCALAPNKTRRTKLVSVSSRSVIVVCVTVSDTVWRIKNVLHFTAQQTCLDTCNVGQVPLHHLMRRRNNPTIRQASYPGQSDHFCESTKEKKGRVPIFPPPLLPRWSKTAVSDHSRLYQSPTQWSSNRCALRNAILTLTDVDMISKTPPIRHTPPAV